jgi:pimeloyl-ACP methyl ester carboxylesterase
MPMPATDVREATVQLPGDPRLRVQVLQGGKGLDLLYLHGEAVKPRWTEFLDLLARDFCVTAPTLPGIPPSEGLEALDHPLDVALAYHDLVRTLGLERPIIVGHSIGGMLAAEMAAVEPDRVDALVLAAPLGLWDDAHPVVDLFALLPWELMETLVRDPSSPVVEGIASLPNDPQALEAALIERIQAQAACAKFLWPIPDRGLKKRLHRIRVPTLVLWGTDDRLAVPTYGERFRAAIRGARLELVPDCGHMIPYEQPQRLAAAVRGLVL